MATIGKKVTQRELVDAAIAETAAAYAYVAKLGNRKPNAVEVIKLHGLATQARTVADAVLESTDKLSEGEEWDLLTKAAIPIETLMAVNVASLADARAAASKVQDLALQAADLSGVTASAKAQLDFVISRAEVIRKWGGKSDGPAPDWTTIAGCTGANFWEPCPEDLTVPILIIVAILLAKKYLKL